MRARSQVFGTDRRKVDQKQIASKRRSVRSGCYHVGELAAARAAGRGTERQARRRAVSNPIMLL